MIRLLKIGVTGVLLLAMLMMYLPLSQAEASGGVRVQEEVHFTMDEGTDIVGSVFLPPETVKMRNKGFPLVILIHGWGGDRTTFEYPQYARKLAKDGFAVLT